MRRVVLLEHVSLDGFAAGLNGEMNWITYDSDVEAYVHTLHSRVDTAIYGRNTYQMMKSYWPTVLTDPKAAPSALDHARWLDQATKVLVSRTVDHDDWNKSLVIGRNLAQEVNDLKQQPGQDLWLIGSIRTAQTFIRLGLVDEYWLNVNPVALGQGQSIFAGLESTLKLKLVTATPFKCGVVGLQYVPAE
ncbi:MAG TPA: dihydrofolate reductase family protein [Phototrophicaceae bacterium]|nr:dihydrofolate reductase family protein [Phototrophicaceae bacterium]